MDSPTAGEYAYAAARDAEQAAKTDRERIEEMTARVEELERLVGLRAEENKNLPESRCDDVTGHPEHVWGRNWKDRRLWARCPGVPYSWEVGGIHG